MSDNTQLNTGSGGDQIRTLQKAVNAPVKTQVVAIDMGGGDASAETLLVAGQSNTQGSLPVALPADQAPVPVMGVVQIGNQPGDLSQEIPVVGRVTDDIVAVAGVPIVQGTGVPVAVQGAVSIAAGTQVGALAFDAFGNPLKADQYGGSYFLHTDSSAAGTDGSAYNPNSTANFPQVELIAGAGSDGNVHSLSVDAAGNLNVNIGAVGTLPVQITNAPGDLAQEIPVVGRTTDDIVAVAGVPLVPGAGVPVAVQGGVTVSNLPATQAVSGVDGALATLGNTSDQVVYTPTQSTAMAQFKGINDGIQTLIGLQQQTLSALNAVISQLQANGAQLGAAPVQPNTQTLQ